MNRQRNRPISPRLPRAARTGVRPDHRPGATDTSTTPGALWGVAEVGAYLRVSVQAVYKMTARHAAVPIPHIRLGGKLRFRQADVDRWLSLLTVSNLDVLAKLREKVSQVRHGKNSQAPTG